MRDGHAHQPGQHVVGLGGVGDQSAVLELVSSLADPDCPAQVIADFGSKSPVAAVDRVLHIAQHMGEADLVCLAQFLLAGITIRDPHIGLMAGQDLFGDMARPARGDLVQHGLVREEHPLPMDDAVGARGGLV